MRPRVIVHNAISLDGRMDWFGVDLETYYGLAVGMGADAILTGSGTILAVDQPIPDEAPDDLTHEVDPRDDRPLFVVVDSRGRIRAWHWLRRQPYWRDVVVLISNSTPDEYRRYLESLNMNYIIAGEDKVSLRDALEELERRFGVKKVRVDSGGTLNVVLMRQGLVDEISVLVHPCLVGGTSSSSIYRAPDLVSGDGVSYLRLKELQRVKEDLVWMYYWVVRD